MAGSDVAYSLLQGFKRWRLIAFTPSITKERQHQAKERLHQTGGGVQFQDEWRGCVT